MPSADESGGFGGTQPAPLNVPGALTGAVVTPGVSGQILAARVVIAGPAGELLVYSPTQGAGNLLASIAGQGGVDGFGNVFFAGFATYTTLVPGVCVATQVSGAGIIWYSAASEAGPWGATAQISVGSAGNAAVTFAAGAGSWPQAGGSGITTVAQVVTVLENLGLLTP